MPTSKTQALRIARSAYTRPYKRGLFSWAFSGPFYADRPTGPRTEFSNSSYPEVMWARARMVAETALCLMGVPPQEAAELTGTSSETTVTELVETCLVRVATSSNTDSRRTQSEV